MSTRLHKCLCLVLVTMLLASISMGGGALTASADTKTGNGLAAYAMNAYNEGWQYVWGGASYGYVDCSGLIYSYVGSGARVTEDMLYSSPESGNVSDGVPDIPGLGLWQPGHVGVYVGGGMAVDARDEISNVCYQSVASKSWVMWFKVAGVTYDTTNVANNDTQSGDTDGRNDTDSVSDTANSDSSVLSKGDQGADVNELQERLKELGYFEENTTYYFGSYTESCLMDFQRAANLSPTGILDEATRAELFAYGAPYKVTDEPSDSVQSDAESSDYYSNSDVQNSIGEDSGDTDSSLAYADSDTYDSDLEYVEDGMTDSVEEDSFDTETDTVTEQTNAYQVGDGGEGVTMIQQRLAELGYYESSVSGVYDEDTAYAVAQFQLSTYLDATGSVDTDTWDLLFNYDFALGSQDNSDSDTEEYVEGEYSVDTEADSYGDTNTDDAEEAEFDNGVLSEGMTGEDVMKLQTRLFELRYLADEPTGFYGSATVAAVGFFQEVSGYLATNYITAEQLELLNSASAQISPEYNNLKLGYKGQDVVALQDKLVAASCLSYSDVEQLGVYDAATKSAVIKAQQDLGLEANGVADVEFTEKLASVEQTATSDTAKPKTSNTSNKSNTSKQSTSESNTVSKSTSASVDVPKTGIDDIASKSLALIAVCVSMLVVLFFTTLRYWNYSMEKRRKRARKEITVSAYRRRYM
ncbi:MAG: peptidoglycan-binding protein [Lachnospiraceae bacterium]|nr:peptidoglycan-binding protein [Lachnospiraceae bacterium]